MTQIPTRSDEALGTQPESDGQIPARQAARGGARRRRSRGLIGAAQSQGVRQEAGEEEPGHGNAGRVKPVARRGRSHVKVWAVVSLSMVGGMYWLGWHSPLTTVTQLGVVAPKGISAQDVRAASGLTQADHVPAVDRQAVELAIMSRLPAVAAVEVQRRMPHTVNLVVTARQPLAALSMRKGYVLLDTRGVAYDRLARPPQGLTVMLADSDAGRATALAVLNSLPGQLQSRVSAIRASTGDDVVLTLSDSAEVRWGSASQSALKVAVLASLMQVKAKVYDVTAPMMPTTEGSLQSPSPTP